MKMRVFVEFNMLIPEQSKSITQAHLTKYLSLVDPTMFLNENNVQYFKLQPVHT